MFLGHTKPSQPGMHLLLSYEHQFPVLSCIAHGICLSSEERISLGRLAKDSVVSPLLIQSRGFHSKREVVFPRSQ
jgi:hypothetical protein